MSKELVRTHRIKGNVTRCMMKKVWLVTEKTFTVTKKAGTLAGRKKSMASHEAGNTFGYYRGNAFRL
jgi:hypothetical protein